MEYFNNPRTEEELKDQFRKLLIKHDYRNPKNEKLIKAIRKEYEEKLLQIKRANGYQTLGEKAINTVKAYTNELERERQQERQRISQLKNKVYTKQEYTELLNKEKRYIDRIIQAAVKDENTVYLSLKAKSKSNDYIVLYRFFTSNSLRLQTTVNFNEFNSLREQIEYATEYLTPNKKQYETLMTQIETMMGKQIAQSLIKYEDMYVDPINIQKTDSMYKDYQHAPKSLNSAIHLILTVPAYIILVISVLLALTSGEGGLFAIALICVVWIAFIELWNVLVVKPHERKKNRMRTHNDAVANEKLSKGLAHLISSLFR